MRSAAIAIAAILTGLSATPWSAAAQEAHAGAMAFAEALVRDYPYALTDAERAELDAIHRTLREADGAIRRAETEDAKQPHRDAASAAMAQLDEGLQARAAIEALPAADVPAFQSAQVPIDDATARIITLRPGVHGGELHVPARLRLPGDIGAVLFRVEGTEPGTAFQVHPVDFAERSGLYTIRLDSPAETWLMVPLLHVPQHRTAARFAISGPGTAATVYLEFDTPPWGLFDLTVLSDDSGEPTPAMVRLVWHVDQRDRKPGNAIEFAPQFERQGTPSGRRHVNLPGPFDGQHFWCVPGPVQMALPPGTYDIAIRRGAEHAPVTETFEVQSGETVTRTYRPARWVDMRRHGWYSGDDHVHCRILSDDDAERLMAWVQAEDIRLANVVKMGDIERTYFEQRGFGPDFRVEDDGYILSPGQECPRTHAELGHTLSMNITSMVRDIDQYYLYDYVFDTVHEQGGLTGYAHINSGIFHVHRDMSINIPKRKVDFAEVLQFSQLGTNLYYDFLNLGFRLTASAGSDVPWGGSVGEVRVYAYLGRQPFNADNWFEAVRKGRTFVTNGPMIDFVVNRNVRPGDTVTADDGDPVRVRVKAWGRDGGSAPIKLELIRFGQAVETVEAASAEGEPLELDVELAPGKGYWLAARADGADGTVAHTTPVFIERPGFRFWDFDNAEDLLAKRIASLDEIVALVRDTQNRFQAGELDTTRRDHVQLAVQGDALIERVEAARAIYIELDRVRQDEAARRE